MQGVFRDDRSSNLKFSELKGRTFKEVIGLEEGSREVVFRGDESYRLWHDQDCCESVSIYEVHGDPQDLVGTPILLAEEIEGECLEPPPNADSYTWTFYKLATIKGYVTIRWLGESNGYYSESVSFGKC